MNTEAYLPYLLILDYEVAFAELEYRALVEPVEGSVNGVPGVLLGDGTFRHQPPKRAETQHHAEAYRKLIAKKTGRR
jgi:hypothetical protein